MQPKNLSLTYWLPLLILITSSIVTFDYYFNPTEQYFLALLFLPITVILTGLFLRKFPLSISEPEQVTGQSFRFWQVILCVMGIFCFWILGQTHSPFTPVWTFLYRVHHHYQIALWVLGMGLIIWGVTGGLPIRSSRKIIRQWAQDADSRWLLLITVFGLFVRGIILGSAVPNYIDEAPFANAINALGAYSDIKIMSSMGAIANFTWIYVYWQHFYTELFGSNLATLRSVSVILGTLTIPSIYLLGRWAFNRRIGLLAAFLIAIDLPHIHFSRLAMNNIADPLFGVLAIAFMWRGLQIRSWRYMAWGGIFLGMTSYFYEGGRLLFPALIIAWLLFYTVICLGRIYKRGLLILLVATGVVASGFYLPLEQLNNGLVAPRLTSERITDEYWYLILTDSDPIAKYIEERLTPPYLHIMSQPDASRFYYSPNDALILPYLLPFLFIGLGVAIFYWRRLGLLFPFWILLTIAGNSLIWSNDWTPRFVVVFPALALLIALGLDHIYRSISWRWRNQNAKQKILFQVALGCMLVLGVFQTGYYFAVMLPEYNLVYRSQFDEYDATLRAQSLLPETEVYIFVSDARFTGYIYDVQAFEQHTVGVQLVQSDTFDFHLIQNRPDEPFGFFIDPDDRNSLVTLRYLFGDALIGPVSSPFNVPIDYQYALYHVNQ